jgi:hypothetical protein
MKQQSASRKCIESDAPRFSIADAAHLHQALAVYRRFPQGGSLVQSLRAHGVGTRLTQRSCRTDDVQPFGGPT